MKGLLCSLMSLFFVLSGFANTYYVSSLEGDDGRTPQEAQDPRSPWKTVERLNLFIAQLQPGDSVLFKCEETFVGTLRIYSSGTAGSPIVFSSYGTGNKPVISGVRAIENWSPLGNGIWRSSCDDCNLNVRNLFLNGKPKPVGRYPNVDDANKGFLTVESHEGSYRIRDSHLPQYPDWTGGEIVIRKNRWIIDKYRIVAHNGNTLTYQGTGYNYEPTDSYGYFLQNHISTLDLDGEWCFNPDNKEVDLKLESVNPGDLRVEASYIDTLVVVGYNSNVVLRNLTLFGADKYGIDVYNSQNIVVSACTFISAGINAINASNNQNLLLKDNLIEDANSDAIVANGCFYCSIDKNEIHRTGMVRGMGYNDDDTYQAIIVRGNNNRIINNNIDSTGYTAIRFEGDFVTVKNNFINHFALVKDDGGGIYTWQAGDDDTRHYERRIEHNIIQNGIGDGFGTNSVSHISANGIYIDGHAGDVTISNNTVSDCSRGGIFFNNPHDNVIEKNTVYNNVTQLYMSHIFEATIGNNLVRGNKLVAKQLDQNVMQIDTKYDDVTSFGNFDSNYYCRPVDDNVIILNSITQGNKYLLQNYNLETWQSVTGKDNGTQKSPVSITDYSVQTTSQVNKYSNGTFDNSTSGAYAWSPEGYCNMKWSNSGRLDQGQMQVSFDRPSSISTISYIVIGIGDVSAGESYNVKFSIAGLKTDKHCDVFLRQSLAPYENISLTKSIMGSDNRMDVEYLFTSKNTEQDASLVFALEEQDGVMNIDNVVVEHASVKMESIDDKMIFLTNPTLKQQTFSLPGSYIDITRNKYSGDITLSPFSSNILLKQPSVTAAQKNLELSASRQEAAVKLEWAPAGTTGADKYEIERSEDGVTFRSIGSMRVNPTSAGRRYSYVDRVPLQGKGFYRIKATASSNQTTLSNTKQIKTEETNTVKISPNPVHSALALDLSGVPARTLITHVIIHAVSGNQLVKKEIPGNVQNMTINVSDLVNGTYFISLMSNGTLISQKTFIKM